MNDLKRQLNGLEEVGRREFVARTAKAALGVSVLPFAAGPATTVHAAGDGTAEHCIFIYLSGGLSHLESFDPKPGAATGGPTKAIATGVPGVEFSEFFPGLAKRFQDLAVIRSMSQRNGSHKGGTYFARTSYKQIATTVHPTIGPWAQALLGKKHPTLPDSVVIGSNGAPGAGFLGPSMAPLPVGDPELGLQDARLPKGVDEEIFQSRLEGMNTFNRAFRGKFKTDEVEAYAQFYDETLKLLDSSDLDAFQLSLESEYKTKLQKYGDNNIGKGSMLAKRLVKAGVRFIEVKSGAWDMHNGLWSSMAEKGGELDKALSALIDDLKAEGLLEKTLIAVGTEFGRTPEINANEGRDHHPLVYSTLFAGGGIAGGQVYGSSDELGKTVKENPVDPRDFNATIAHALGMDLNKKVFAPSGRPFLVAGHTRGDKPGEIVTQGKPLPLFG